MAQNTPTDPADPSNATTTTSPAKTEAPDEVIEHPRTHLSLQLIGALFILTLVVYAAFTWTTPWTEVLGLAFDSGPTLALVAIVYTVLSIAMVDVNDRAGTLFYGKPLERVGPGPHFVPFLLMQLRKVSRTVQQFQAPGEPETVFKGDDREDLPPGMVRPIRVVSKRADPNQTGILEAQMTLDLSFMTTFQVTNLFEFTANYGDLDEVKRQLRDIGETLLGEEMSKLIPAEFIEKQEEINKRLDDKMHERFDHSGIKIISCRLVSPDVSHKVSSELANIPVERAKAQQTVTKAEAEKTKRLREGEGAAGAEEAFLAARANGLKKQRDELRVSGSEVLAAQAVRDIGEDTDVIVAGAEGGMRDLLGLVKGAQSALGGNIITPSGGR